MRIRRIGKRIKKLNWGREIDTTICEFKYIYFEESEKL